MRLVTYQAADGPRVAAVREDGYVDLNGADSELPTCPKMLLGLGADGLARARQAAAKGSAVPRDSVRLLAPVPSPEKVICIGLNYADHAKESGLDIPTEPVVFNKFPSTVCAHGDQIVVPAVAKAVDYEAELVVIIGATCRNVPVDKALDVIAGYACGNDVSARDWQLGRPGGQWLLGKTFDGFAPIGPELVTKDEVADPGSLKIELRLNGQTMQSSSTDQLIFTIEQLVSHLSQVCTLKPGDVIFTGTPPGVGFARDPQVLLKPGDVTEVAIEGVGTLRNEFVGD